MTDQQQTTKPTARRRHDRSDTEVLAEVLRGKPRTDGQRDNVKDLEKRLSNEKMRRVFHDAEEKSLGVKGARVRRLGRIAAGIKVEDIPAAEYADVVNTAKSQQQKARDQMPALTREQLVSMPKTPQERQELIARLANSRGVEPKESKIVG